eukprot:scaffold305482_cov36-Tisochrysis_lutea.AAC.2
MHACARAARPRACKFPLMTGVGGMGGEGRGWQHYGFTRGSIQGGAMLRCLAIACALVVSDRLWNGSEAIAGERAKLEHSPPAPARSIGRRMRVEALKLVVGTAQTQLPSSLYLPATKA